MWQRYHRSLFLTHVTKFGALSSTLDSHFHTLVRSQEQQIPHNLSYSGRKKKPAAHWTLKTPPCLHRWSHHMWPGVRFHDGVSYFIPWHRDLGIFRGKNPCFFPFSSHYFWNFCHITFFSNHTWNYIVSQLNPVCFSQFNSICSHGNWHSYSFV